MSQLKVLFFGDDFTGSSENLAQFHRSGVRCKLYLAVPSAEDLRADSQAFDVLGLAGTTRALAPAEMRVELDAAFARLSTVGCDLVQYKICSTFDSAPDVGSFGVALDAAKAHFGARGVAVLAATPDFGRYTCFGNHFARFGSDVARLDRHPSMSTHPRTPMTEADLKRHLAGQTAMGFENVFVPHLHAPDLSGRLVGIFAEGKGTILDGVVNADVAAGVAALWNLSRQSPLFALAAQGLAQHLGALWAREGLIAGAQVRTKIPEVGQLLVLSGSCALQNGRQIEVAEAAGWAALHLDPASLATDRKAMNAVDRLVAGLTEAMGAGRSAVVYTAKGMDGRAAPEEVPAERLGAVYAETMRRMRSALALPRVVLAGGDSSSYAVRHSGAKALEIAVFDVAQNSHVCRLSAPGNAAVDGLEVMLKGGQVGGDDYFLRARAGTEG